MKTRDADALTRITANFGDVAVIATDPLQLSSKPLDDILQLKVDLAIRQLEVEALRQRLLRHVARLRRLQYSLILRSKQSPDDETKKKNLKISVAALNYERAADEYQKLKKDLDKSISDVETASRLHTLKIFASRLKQARTEANLSQSDLAQKLGIKKSTYCAYEQGRNEPPLVFLQLVSTTLAKSMEWLLTTKNR